MKYAKRKLAGSIAVLLIEFLVGCGTGGGSLNLQVENTAAGTGQGKPLFSLWQEAGNLYQIDLRNSQFGSASSVTLTTLTGQNCVCQVLIQGTDSAGQASFSSCAGTYANCSSFNSTGGAATYTNNETTLQICAAVNNCDTFN